MRISELAKRAGVTVKAARYYETSGMISPIRLSNGYRDFTERDVRLVQEVSALGRLGLRVEQTRPFVECLAGGHGQGDDCVASLDTYRAAIAEITERMSQLEVRREALVALLADADERPAQPTSNYEETH
jgi:DNA-binding transcriptional MerR regulator